MSIEYTNVRTYIHGVTHNIKLWAMTAMECGQWPSYVTYLHPGYGRIYLNKRIN